MVGKEFMIEDINLYHIIKKIFTEVFLLRTFIQVRIFYIEIFRMVKCKYTMHDRTY